MAYAIRESAVFSKPEKVKQYLNGKVIFETYLQEAEEKNQNRRVYPKKVLQEAINRIYKKIHDRAFLGELDHPISSDQIRQTTVLYKESSHLIREVGWDGNLLKGVVESLPYSNNGKILSGLALDKIRVGFSLRGLADVQDSGAYQLVLSPLMMICYDAVSEPSNSKATLQEIRNESFVSVLRESANLVHCSNGHCYIKDYFDEIVEKKLLRLEQRYW